MSADLTSDFGRAKSAPGGNIDTDINLIGNLDKLLKALGLIVSAKSTDLITLQEASKIRQVSDVSLAEMCRHGSLPAFPVKSGNKVIAWLIRKQDLEALPPVKHPNSRALRSNPILQPQSMSSTEAYNESPEPTDEQS